MVAQNTKRKCIGFFLFVTALLNNYTIKDIMITEINLRCAPISELPSNISTMVGIKVFV